MVVQVSQKVFHLLLMIMFFLMHLASPWDKRLIVGNNSELNFATFLQL